MSFAQELKIESWIWFSFACVIVIMRYTSRYMQRGTIKRFQFDDYAMAPVFCCYLGLIITVNIESKTQTNLMYPDEKLIPSSIPGRQYGAVMAMVSEQCMLATCWGCKACLLFIYLRMTKSLRPHLYVKIIAAYTALGYFVVEMCWFFVWCTPFSGYWQVPPPQEQCATYNHHLIMVGSFNISSDILMLSVPIPLLIKASLPLRNKILLCGVFGLGIFVIISAVLSKVFSFINPYSVNWFYWYTREASCAIYVTNIPACWYLLRWIFTLPAFNSSRRGSGNRSHPSGLRNGSARLQSLPGSDKSKKPIWGHARPEHIPSSASEENITGQNADKDVPLEIWHQVGITIEHDDDGSSHGSGEVKNAYQAKVSVV